MVNDRLVSYEEGKEFAERKGMDYFEISARNNRAEENTDTKTTGRNYFYCNNNEYEENK